ncbi:Regulatory protein-like protein [Emericellopsis cladophorae]|uniref:Regulatory protein-like protein n=1 Tax=Emericellopsis cladophorae TaxID=2686198 RepID=A0A9Q0BDV2_9HYPO|nr:Regulatory protein-like protein [Emericellopsis cladophorae]KAI6780574.1 Regulatory protein-like protein [Emericellopsis cladophorae]
MAGTPNSIDTTLACDSCRIKKLKCSKQRPVCSACCHHGRVCNYSGKIARSPLTRAYLTSVEQRLRQVEDLFAELLPEVDLEEALASQGTGGLEALKVKRASATPVATHALETSASDVLLEESISEAVPAEADGFDWQEDVNELADGMAALSVEPKGTGYLAGVFFLRSLLFWLGYPGLGPGPQGRLGDSPENYDRVAASSRLAKSIGSRQVVEHLMDSYFLIYHRTYPFIHEASFRAQYHEVIPRPRYRSWQMLLHTVLALGAWCIDESQEGVDDDLYHKALQFGEDESLFESANLTLIQALVLLSNLSQKRNKPNTGSNFLGLASRMALSLGLHRELPDWDINLLQREMRRRVWWGLYIFDSGASTTFGRPIILPSKVAMDVHPVLNIPDECLTARTTSLPTESVEPTLYAGLKWQSDLHVHSNHISNLLLSSIGLPPEDVWSLNKELDDWVTRLPSYFQIDSEIPAAEPAVSFARCRLWWRFWNLKIILFRQILMKRAVERAKQGPFPLSTDIENMSRDAAVAAARATIASISSFTESRIPTRLVAWYSIYFLFHASLVVALAVLGDTDSPELATWQADIDKVTNVFRNAYAGNPLAQRCADILGAIVPAQPAASDPWNLPFDDSLIDFATWPNDAPEFFGPLGWPGAGPGI